MVVAGGSVRGKINRTPRQTSNRLHRYHYNGWRPPPSRYVCTMGIAALIVFFLYIIFAAKKVHAFQPRLPLGGQRLESLSLRWKRHRHAPFYTTVIDNRKTNVRHFAAESDSIAEELVEELPLSLESKQRDGSNDDASSMPESSLPEETIDAVSSPSNPIDESLVNKYYQKKLKLMAEEANTMTESSVEEKSELAESTDVAAALPPTNILPRRRFADFGIASERAEPINGKISEEESKSSVSSDDSSTSMKLRGFSEFGRPQFTITKDDNAFSSDEVSPSTAAVATTVEKPTISTIMVPQQSKLIISQPSTPANNLPVPKDIGFDFDTTGQPLVILLGIVISLALGISLKQVSDINSKLNSDGKKSGFFENITNESNNLLQKIKDAGTAGAISYALWEAAFWGISIPICLVSYRQVMGRWPDLTSGEDVKKLGLEAFAFVNFARLAVPIRIGLALSTAPWVAENVLPVFTRSNEDKDGGMASESGNSISPPSFSDNLNEKSLTVRNEAPEEPIFPMTTISSANADNDEGEMIQPSGISQVEGRLRRIETEAMRISTMAAESMTSGADLTPFQERNVDAESFSKIYDYCEAGQVNNACSESIRGYLDTLARTGAIATDGEVKAIVGYLDSLSSNVVPHNINSGAAFTSYLDALSMGSIPAPSSATTVANYLNVLSKTSPEEEGEQIGSRINEVEERLSRLESSIGSLPDEIASRLVNWQINQDKKKNDDMEKIMKLLVDGKSITDSE